MRPSTTFHNINQEAIKWGLIRFQIFEGIEMNTATMKLWLRRILWMSPFISYLIYCILIYIVEVNRHTVFYENYGQVVEENMTENFSLKALVMLSQSFLALLENLELLEILN